MGNKIFMFKKTAVILCVFLSLVLQSCGGVVSGLKTYVDVSDGYQFSYPNVWSEVQVKSGPDVVFHDIIETTENVSVVISPVPEGKSLKDLGTPSEIGYQLQKRAIAPPGSHRQAELVNVASREVKGQTYYLMEYAVKIGEADRHDLASVTVSRGKLYTFNASTTDRRWQKAKNMLETVVKSFLVN
jgi:photosystem II oxygen-evolving enhancer protein 2